MLRVKRTSTLLSGIRGCQVRNLTGRPVVSKYQQQQQGNDGAHRSKWWHDFCAFSTLFATATVVNTCLSYNDQQTCKNTAHTLGKDKYSTIVVGGGTAGCTVAYLTAKWMQDNNIPGKILLVDRGVDFFDAKNGPDPLIGTWFENWGIYGEAHPAVREDGTAYPVTGSDHRGIGGCGSHDTRITFQPTPETMRRFADMMGWNDERVYMYYQAALNLMPLTPAIPAAHEEAFYSAIMANAPTDMARVPDNEHKTLITSNSIAQSTLAAYHNELRWTSAYLLHPSVKPSNLEVLSNATAEKVLLERSKLDGSLRATGVVLHVGVGESEKDEEGEGGGQGVEVRVVALDEHGEVALTGGAFGAVSVLQRSGVGPRAALEAAGVPVLVDNEHVGHGVDHPEIAVMYGWMEKWNDSDGNVPRGGVMGWPLMAFLPFRPELKNLFASAGSEEESLSNLMVAHFGAGCAEPYTDFPTVVCTPNCARPDLRTGYRATITSARPDASLRLVHSEQLLDWQAMAQGVYAAVALLDHYQALGIVGPRLEPPFPVTPENSAELVAWIRENHSTVFHWACTCQAGVQGRVADVHFRVKDTSNKASKGSGDGEDRVVGNLLVGSAASLPELPDANPHLTVTAFSVALAEELVRTQAQRRQVGYCTPSELGHARRDVLSSAAFSAHKSAGGGYAVKRDLALSIRRPGQEFPDVSRVAAEHYIDWKKAHAGK